jgi:hypothetical protein
MIERSGRAKNIRILLIWIHNTGYRYYPAEDDYRSFPGKDPPSFLFSMIQEQQITGLKRVYK